MRESQREGDSVFLGEREPLRSKRISKQILGVEWLRFFRDNPIEKGFHSVWEQGFMDWIGILSFLHEKGFFVKKNKI